MNPASQLVGLSVNQCYFQFWGILQTNQTGRSLGRDWQSARIWLLVKSLHLLCKLLHWPDNGTAAATFAQVQSVFFTQHKLVVRSQCTCTNLGNWQHWENVICYYNTHWDIWIYD